MKRLRIIFVALVSIAAFVSCNKDKSASLTLERTAVYFAAWGDEEQSVAYVAENAVSVAVVSHSDGLEASVNQSARVISIRPVGATEEGKTNDDLPREGSVVVNALNKEGEATSYYIYVYVCESQVLDVDGRANCYIITKPATNYTFDVMHRPDGEPLDTKRVELLWQSNIGVVRNVNIDNGNAIFYIATAEDDATSLYNTNAVVAAYNASGEVIWSWHLWIVNDNPLAAVDTYANGKIFMKQNLGAFANSNGEADNAKILDSYGMYYQWGRKDPFPRPYFYDASDAEDESRYNESGIYLKEVREERSSANGTLEYVTKYPMRFITNAASIEDGGDGVGDWLVVADNNLWSDSKKSIYDPCPYGWRVPTAEDFAVLTLAEAEDNTPLGEARKQFGWHLSDGNSKYFYSACGRRRYTDGKVENMNYKEGVYPSQPEPWEGYYWTSTTTAEGKAVALYFDLTTTRTINKFELDHPTRRANGLQVRCVRE